MFACAPFRFVDLPDLGGAIVGKSSKGASESVYVLVGAVPFVGDLGSRRKSSTEEFGLSRAPEIFGARKDVDVADVGVGTYGETGLCG